MASASRHPASGFGWLLVFMVPVLAVVLFAFSYKRETNFRSEPTTDFVAVSVPAPIDREQWAREYWNCAKSLRFKYTYGVPLPEIPPPEFHIALEETVPGETAERLRLLYWRELQKAWLSSSAWERANTVRLNWMFGSSGAH